MFNYGCHKIEEEDIDAVVKALRSQYITQGPLVSEFEYQIGSKVNARFVKCLSSGTAALHCAYQALGLMPDDILWTVSTTFSATASQALALGAEIDFIDISLETGNLCVDHLKEKLQLAELSGRLPKIITIVHLAGNPALIKEVYELTKRYKIFLVEDASHALGAQNIDEKVGSCKYSDISVFSFHPVKIITTGEGGCITTNNEELYNKINLISSQGIERDSRRFDNKDREEWQYEIQSIGYNYRMSDISAALGLSQIKRLDNIVKYRREIMDFYQHHLNDDIGNILFPLANTKTSGHLAIYRPVKLLTKREYSELIKKLRNSGVNPQLHYSALHKHPFYQKIKSWDLPNSELYEYTSFSLPIFLDLSLENVYNITTIINKVFNY
tara:strand:+ start:6927 stop:8081 length:1155 start_codon:yes stop_codon:yes gene_type:complete